jgi:hypothetical protein
MPDQRTIKGLAIQPSAAVVALYFCAGDQTRPRQFKRLQSRQRPDNSGIGIVNLKNGNFAAAA